MIRQVAWIGWECRQNQHRCRGNSRCRLAAPGRAECSCTERYQNVARSATITDRRQSGSELIEFGRPGLVVGVGTSVCEVPRMMNVHRQVVAPRLPRPQAGSAEKEDREEKAHRFVRATGNLWLRRPIILFSKIFMSTDPASHTSEVPTVQRRFFFLRSTILGRREDC